MSTLMRFMSKVDRSGSPDACWLWTASLRPNGYGQFLFNGTVGYAHRAAYSMFVGPIPDGLHVDHTCHDETCASAGIECPHRRCVNPAHLEAVTQRVNLLRGQTITAHEARKTHCLRNHPFSPENTKITRLGHRECRECRRMRKRVAWRAAA